MLSDKMTVNMNAISEDLYPNKIYSWEFKSGGKSDGTMEFPRGLSVLLKGDSAVVTLKLEKKVEAEEGEEVKEHKHIGSGQIITID